MIRDRPSDRVCTSALLALLISLICILSSNNNVTAFTHSSSFTTSRAPRTYASSSSLSATTTSSNNNKKNVVVISPPGGIGEIASISAARLGGNVKWFVVSAPSPKSSSRDSSSIATNNKQIALTTETLTAISNSGGSMDFAGSSADDLCNLTENESTTNSALSAMSSWLQESKGDSNEYSIICTYDGALQEKQRVAQFKSPEELELSIDEEEMIKSGIRLAARKVIQTIERCDSKIGLLAANEENVMMGGDDDENENGGVVGGLIGDLFGGNKNKLNIPSTLYDALGGKLTTVVRYGELFGAPESSPESSPFMGGPRRDPTVRDMYTLRAARIDPTIHSSSSNNMDTKSNRLAVGEVASQLGLGMIDSINKGKTMMDVSLSSFAGTETPTNEEWNAEFERVISNMKLSSTATGASSGAQLFTAEFSSVPNVKRLSDWVATKWAPTILRSYDIAGTRVGARPVYALQSSDDDTKTEIVWQELVDFKSVTSGRMIITVSENGITASRGPGNASDGFGVVSSTPLPGEDILVRRLADAASQAVEKGLAVKPQLTEKAEKTTAEVVVKEPAVAAVAASSTTAPTQPTVSSDGPGPRSAGARRSSERSRGKSRRRKTDGGAS